MNRFAGIFLTVVLALTASFGLTQLQGCTAQQQEAVGTLLNPKSPDNPEGPGALDNFFNTLLNKPIAEAVEETPGAASEYISQVLLGGGSLTIAGLIGLFTNKPGTKKKALANEDTAFEKGKVAGQKIERAINTAAARTARINAIALNKTLKTPEETDAS